MGTDPSLKPQKYQVRIENPWPAWGQACCFRWTSFGREWMGKRSPNRVSQKLLLLCHRSVSICKACFPAGVELNTRKERTLFLHFLVLALLGVSPGQLSLRTRPQ